MPLGGAPGAAPGEGTNRDEGAKKGGATLALDSMRWLLGLHTAPFSARAAATAAAAAACAVCTGSTRPWEPRTWTIAQAAAPTFYEKHLK